MRTAFLTLSVLLVGLSSSGCSQTAVESAPNESSAPDVAVDVQAQGDGIRSSDVSTPLGSIVINEIVARPDDGDPDWVELWVSSDVPVSLDAYRLVDSNPDHEPAPIGSGTAEPGTFIVIHARGAEAVEGELGFKLGASDALTLSRDGVVVDELSWSDGEAPETTSFGRLPDGSGPGQTLTPTPGAPNEALEGPVPAQSPFVTDRVLEVEIELSEDAWAAILADPAAEAYHEGNILYDGPRVDTVAVRLKGNSSLNSVANNPNTDRFSFKVDTNYYVDGQKLRGVKKLNFNNGFKDPSMIREHLGYRLATELGLAAPRTAFADLTIAGVHMGLYTVVEQVDDDFVERWFADAAGDLYKPDWPDGHLLYQGEAFEDYGGLEIKTNEDTSDHSAFLHFVNVINGNTDEDLDSVLDVETMLRYMALNTALVNLDSYTGNGHNYYCYEQSGVFSVIPWDLNEAFGNFNCGCDRAGVISLMMDEPTCGAVSGKPLVAQVLAVEAHKARYHELLGELLSGPFSSEVMDVWIDEAADLIRPTVEADTTKFFSTAQFEQNLEADVGGAIGLKPFVAERAAALKAQLAGTASAGEDGSGSCQGGVPGGGGGPGGGGPGGGNPKCPDDLCDAFEKQNCICAVDCSDDPTWQANCGS